MAEEAKKMKEECCPSATEFFNYASCEKLYRCIHEHAEQVYAAQDTEKKKQEYEKLIACLDKLKAAPKVRP